MKFLKAAAVFLLLAVIVFSCVSRVPITNRKQVLAHDEVMLIDQASLHYDEFLSTNYVLPQTDARAQQVTRVGMKIKDAAVVYLTKKNQLNRIDGFKWQFNTVMDSMINAWCMPGGLVVVYTGILGLTADDDELAVIMGHEVAHAIARHGNERITTQYGKNIGAILAGSRGQVFQTIYGVGSTLGVLAYSRKHESEADKIGLVFAKIAGYDPYKAISFWEKMAAGGGAVPEVLSTHPSDETRIADIKAFLKEIDKHIE
jgi:predicted Zn-dependent protease